MTGAYFRVKRNNKFENIELEYLTDYERHKTLSKKERAFVLSCLNLVCNKLAELEPLLKELEKDGIIGAV